MDSKVSDSNPRLGPLPNVKGTLTKPTSSVLFSDSESLLVSTKDRHTECRSVDLVKLGTKLIDNSSILLMVSSNNFHIPGLLY